MTSLQQKLNQLNLTTMSLHLDQTLTDAASKNLSAAEAFEALLDRELEARHTRSIDRRFRLSRLQAKHSIDSFNFNHHKTRLQCKSRILRLLDLGFLEKGTGCCADRESRRGENVLSEDHRLARLPGQPPRAVHHRHGHAQPLAGLAGRSLSDPQAQALYRANFSPHRRARISFPRPADLQSVLSGHFHSSQPQRSTLITTNTAFSDWGNILYNTTIATAIADRLVENSEIILLGGESLRKANKGPPPTE